MTRLAAVLMLLLAPGALLIGCGQGPRATSATAGPSSAGSAASAPSPARATTAAGVRGAPVATTRPSTRTTNATEQVAQPPRLAPAHDDEGAALRRTLQADPDPAARRAALDQWTRTTRDQQPVLDVLFTDSDPLVRRWAALALERSASAEAAARVGPAIAQALRAERDPAVRSILSRVERRLAR